jgi:S-adenosylmethionine uptake transporter
MVAAYRHAPVVVVSPMQYSQIIWAAILGAALFGEVPTLSAAVGIAVIIAAGLFILWHSGRPAAPAG